MFHIKEIRKIYSDLYKRFVHYVILAKVLKRSSFFLRHSPKLKYHYALFKAKSFSIKEPYEILKTLKPEAVKDSNILKRLSSQMDVLNDSINENYSSNKNSKALFTNRILMAIHSSAPYDMAGYWYRTSSLLSALRTENISVVCATRPGYPWDLQKHRDKTVRKLDVVQEVAFYRLPILSTPYKRGSDFDYVSDYAEHLVGLASNSRISIIHGHSNYLNGLAAVQAAKKIGGKSIYEARGFWHITQQSKVVDYGDSDLFEYESRMEIFTLNGADRVVTLSNAMKKLIVSWGVNEEKIHVIPNAVDIELFKPQKLHRNIRSQWSDSSIVIGFIGSLTVYEGLSDLIESVSALVRKGYDLQLVIAGSGPIEDDLLKRSLLLDFVHVVGRISHESVTSWYSCFDLCVYPRTDDVVCRYVPPMKVLEAMAMEVPVIVSNLDPLTEMVKHEVNGFVCNPSDVKSLTSTIELALSDMEKLNIIAKNSRQWVIKNRTWELNVQRYKSLYESLN